MPSWGRLNPDSLTVRLTESLSPSDLVILGMVTTSLLLQLAYRLALGVQLALQLVSALVRSGAEPAGYPDRTVRSSATTFRVEATVSPAPGRAKLEVHRTE